MPRRVIEGTANAPITVRPADLPRNADYSYLRHVRLAGTWGATRSLRYLDVVSVECNADLSAADITGIASYRSKWADATLSIEQEKAACCNFDIRHGRMREAFRSYQDWPQGGAHVEALLAEFAQHDDRKHIDAKRFLLRAATVAGVDLSVILPHIRAIVAQKPHLLPTYKPDEDVNAPRERGLVVSNLSAGANDRGYMAAADFTQPMRDAIARRDRWALARAAELAALAFFGKAIVARCRQMFPVLDLVAVPRRMLTHPEEWGMTFPPNWTIRQREQFLEGPGRVFRQR